MSDISGYFSVDSTQTLQLKSDSAPGAALGDQLLRCTNGAPIVVSQAARSVQDGRVTVTGRTSFLNVFDLPITATAVDGPDGPVVTLRFTLIDGPPGANAWRFSRSFPALPPFAGGQRIDKAVARTAPLPNLLDSLVLSDAAFVITTAAGVDAVTGAPLQPGLNFVAHLTPTGLLGLLGSVVSGGGPLKLYGPIHIPAATEITVPSQPMPLMKFPWQRDGVVPGVSLTADLGIDQTVGSALRLHDVGLRIYSPPSQAWSERNPSYSPMVAAAAKLAIPSAGMALDLTALGIGYGITDRLSLFGLFEGVSLSNLAKLADLGGAGDLSALLPDDVRKTLGDLSLEAISLDLGPGFSVQGAGITIGLPDLDTQVVPGFTVRQLSASFAIADPFGPGRAASLTLGGGLTFLDAPFDVSVEFPDVVAMARLTGPVPIRLDSLFRAVGAPLPSDVDVGPLTVSDMQFSADKAGSFGFAAAMASDPPWTIDLGPIPLTVKNVAVVASRAAGQCSANLGGTIAFGNAFSLAGSYQTPGNFVLRGDIPDVKLSDIVKTLTDGSLQLPGGFDIDFEDSYAMIQKTGGDYSFQFATTMERLGTVALEVRRTVAGGGTWGIAAGIDLTGVKLSELPGLGGLAVFEEVFRLDELVLVVSSFGDPTFAFPALAAFNGPMLRTGNVDLPTQSLGGGVVAGFNVFAKWTLDTSKQQALLQKLLGLSPSLGITLQVGRDPAANSKLFVAFSTTIRGMPFSCQFGGAIVGGQIELFLTGILQVEIQGRPVRFDLTMLFVANGAFLSGSMQGTIDFDVLKLSNLALVVGTDWEGIPSLGLMATLDIEGLDSSVAVFFDSADPSRSMLAGSVSDLTLKGVVDAFVGPAVPSMIDDVLSEIALVGTQDFTVDGSLAAHLDNMNLAEIATALKIGGVTISPTSSQVLVVTVTPGKQWAITDLVNVLHYELLAQGSHITVKLNPQIYCAPATTMLGNFTFQQGLFFNTGLQLLFLKASAKVLVRPSQGISIDGSMDRIVIGTEALFSISSVDGTTGPTISGATFAQPQLAEPLRSPHLIVDGKLEILGVERAIVVSVTKQGFVFKLGGKIGPALDADLDGTFTGLNDLNVHGALKVGLDTIDLGPLGKVTIGTGAGGDFTIGVKDEKIGAWFAGAFSFAAQTLTLPKLELDVRTASLLDLAKHVFDLVKQALEDLFKDAVKWAELVGKGFIAGVEDVGQVLQDVYHKTADEAKSIVDKVGDVAKGCASKAALGLL